MPPGQGRRLETPGVSILAIARRTGHDQKTVRKYLNNGLELPIYGPRPPRGSVLDPYKDYIQGKLEAFPDLSAARLFREVRALFARFAFRQTLDFVNPRTFVIGSYDDMNPDSRGFFGNPQALDQRIYKPLLSSAVSMQTVDGLETFEGLAPRFRGCRRPGWNPSQHGSRNGWVTPNSARRPSTRTPQVPRNRQSPNGCGLDLTPGGETSAHHKTYFIERLDQRRKIKYI